MQAKEVKEAAKSAAEAKEGKETTEAKDVKATQIRCCTLQFENVFSYGKPVSVIHYFHK